MPIYEYAPEGHECLICDGRVEVMQGIKDEPLKFCPTCGLDVKRLISRPAFKIDSGVSADKAAEKGFSTFRRVGHGQYEKIAGEGGPSQFDASNIDTSE